MSVPGLSARRKGSGVSGAAGQPAIANNEETSSAFGPRLTPITGGATVKIMTTTAPKTTSDAKRLTAGAGAPQSKPTSRPFISRGSNASKLLGIAVKTPQSQPRYNVGSMRFWSALFGGKTPQSKPTLQRSLPAADNIRMQPEVWATIKRLSEVENIPIAEIARRVGRDRKTVRRALMAQNVPVYTRAHKSPSKLDPFKGYIQERVREYPRLTATALLEEIRRQGYTGKIRILVEHVATLKQKAKEVFLRLETLPGQQAQCDWANCGTVAIGNTTRKLSLFVMVLSWSRSAYIEFTLSQCLEDFIQCHINAWRFFQGIPRKVLYDNLKLVVLSRLGERIQFNPKFMEFAGIFGFEPVPCNVARGNEKGKAESFIHFTRMRLLEGKEIRWPDIREQGFAWLSAVANARLHRVTQERPADRWEKEKIHLLPIPEREYDASILKAVRSTHQALVRFDGNAYSVPHQCAYKTLTLRAAGQEVRLFSEGKEIACHRRSYERGLIIEDQKHFEGILAAKKKALAGRTQKSFMELGDIAGNYLEGLADTHVHIGRHIAQIMELAASYGKEEVLQAMQTADGHKAYGAAYVQNIIEQQRAAKGLREILPIRIPEKPSWNELLTEEPDLSLYDRIFEEKPDA